MAPSNTEDKKGNEKEGGTRTNRSDLEEENQQNVELEMQIQGEMKRAQGGDRAQVHGEGLEGEAEMEDEIEDRENIPNKEAKFSVVAPRAPRTRSERNLRGDPVTPTKIFGDSKVLKRSINDLSFTPEPLTRKNPKTGQNIEDSFLSQILFKLELLSKTVESQTAQIVALESRIEELTMLSKGNNQVSKANRAATCKIETMANRVAAMASTSTSLSGLISATSSPQSMSKAGLIQKSASNVNNTSLYISLNLSQCAVSLNERPSKEI